MNSEGNYAAKVILVVFFVMLLSIVGLSSYIIIECFKSDSDQYKKIPKKEKSE